MIDGCFTEGESVRTATEDFKNLAGELRAVATSRMTEHDILAALAGAIVASRDTASPEDWVWFFTTCTTGKTLDFVVQLLDEKLLPVDQVRGVVIALYNSNRISKEENSFVMNLLETSGPTPGRADELIHQATCAA